LLAGPRVATIFVSVSSCVVLNAPVV
jgi:hypothetical protein